MPNLSTPSVSLWRGAALGFLLAIGIPNIASASEELPTELLEVAEFDCLPACSNCHTSDPGQSGTASQRLALLLQGKETLTRADGQTLVLETELNPAEPETLHVAYDSLDVADGNPADGIITDPQTEAVIFSPDTAICQAEVDYGCSIDSSGPSAQQSFTWWAPLLLSVLGLGAFVRRRRSLG